LTGYFLRRLGWLVLTLWIVFTIAFFLMRKVPGGPYQSERNLTPEIEANMRAYYQLDQPLHVQYLHHLWSAIQFDFGPSYTLQDYTVSEVIAQGFPISASMGIFALAFALALGLTAGIISALRRQTVLDVGVMLLATLGIAVPNFVLASGAIVLFVFQFSFLPAAGWGSLEQLVLPSICLGAPFAAYIARLTRTGMLEVLSQDYIRTAYAKGLTPRRVVLRHALRGAVLPVVSYLGPAVAGIMTGSLVLERIFALPGMGSHFVDAAVQRDFTLAMGMVLVYTSLLYTMNFLVDVSYAFIDPRVKLD
jgi:oligopeptide transport system permease protein